MRQHLRVANQKPKSTRSLTMKKSTFRMLVCEEKHPTLIVFSLFPHYPTFSTKYSFPEIGGD